MNSVQKIDRTFSKCQMGLALIFAILPSMYCFSQSSILWSSAAGSAWLTGSNWTGGSTPGINDIAQFGVNPTPGTSAGINMNGSTNNGANNQAVGAIEILDTRLIALTIGNSSTSANGTLTFNGASVNSVNNVIVRNNSSQSLTIQNIQGSGNKTMAVALNNSSDNVIRIDAAGGVTISSIVSGSNPLTVSGSGTGIVALTGANTYTGNTTVTGATLQLNRTGGTTIPNTNNVTINGGTLKVSTNQTIANLTISSGKLTVDAGVTLTVTGTYSGSGGTISNSGTIKLNGGATSFPGAGVTINNGTSNTMTNLQIATSADVTLTTDFTVSGTLTMTSGLLVLGSNNLTIGSSGSMSGGSATSYVKTDGAGTISQTVSGLKSFLIGNSSYNPITSFTNSGTSDKFSFRVLDDVYDGGSSGNVITSGVVDRTWEITEALVGGSSISLTVQWNASEELTSFTRSQCYVSQFISGTNWNAGTAGAAGGSGPYTRNRSGITSLTDFAIASGGVLPIRLTQLSAKALDNFTSLSWQTATEQDNDYFSIERSANGQSYREIGQVKGAGTSYEPKDYTFTDERPLPGKNYYRLRQVDFDGKYSYSPVVTAVFGSARTLTLAPVPANESLSLQLEKGFEQDGTWQVFDMNGRQLLDGKLPAETKEKALDVSSLPEGAYVLRLNVGQEVFVEQFRKQ